MTPTDYLSALDDDGTAFAAATEGNLTAPVSSCPGWTVADLVYHLGEVHRFWGTIVSERLTEMDTAAPLPARPDDEDLLAWYRDGFAALRSTLSDAEPDVAVWTWSSQQDVAFVQRRMAHETAVHRWDAQLAAHVPGPIEAALAVDGIDEFLTFMLDGGAEGDELVGGSVHLHVTDDDLDGGEWMVRFEGRTPNVSTGHDKGDAALRGTASDLLLALWRRKSIGDLDVVGDEALAARFLAASNLE